MMTLWQATQNTILADLEIVGQDHHLQKSLYLGYCTAHFSQSLTKMSLLTTKASHQLTLKV